MEGPHAPHPRTLSLRSGAAGAKTFATTRGSRDHGQWQAHPGEPRHRYSAGGSPFLLLSWLGAVIRARVSRVRTLRSSRSNHSVEFSATHVGVENRTGAGNGKHRGVETCRIYSTDGARVRGTVSRTRVGPGAGGHR